jgi:hypothetical protein
VAPPAPIEPIEGVTPDAENGGAAPDAAAPVGAAGAKARDIEAECRARCEAERSACLPGCETKPTGCAACEPSFDACLAICGSDR